VEVVTLLAVVVQMVEERAVHKPRTDSLVLPTRAAAAEVRDHQIQVVLETAATADQELSFLNTQIILALRLAQV
jgi:hypothetical protein